MKQLAMMLLICALVLPCAAGDKLSAKQVVEQHVASLGPNATKAGVMRDLAGRVEMNVLVGGAGAVNGDAFVLSTGRKFKLTMKYQNAEYPIDQVVFDGNQVQVGFIKPGVRSAIGDFLNLQQVIVKEGLLGGTLSSGWALADQADRKANISYDGIKKLDNVEVHQLTYSPKKGTDRLTIRMYFTTDKFQHVRTQYVMTIPPPITGDVITNTRTQTARHTLDERFSNFKEVNGIMMPTEWSIFYEAEGGSGGTGAGVGARSWRWKTTFDDFQITGVK